MNYVIFLYACVIFTSITVRNESWIQTAGTRNVENQSTRWAQMFVNFKILFPLSIRYLNRYRNLLDL